MLERIAAFIEREWKVLKTAPFTFVTLSVLCLGGGFALGMLYYGSQVGSLREQITAKDGQLGRYRVALGIDPASKGALVELSNQELALRAQSIVVQLRQLTSEVEQKITEIESRAKAGEDKSKTDAAKMAAVKDVSNEFDRNLASDAYNVENEVRRRLDPKAMSHVVRVPAFIASDGGRVTLSDLMRGTGFDVLMLDRLADEIEQMVKLLPSDSATKP
jgi:hypothetical protein